MRTYEVCRVQVDARWLNGFLLEYRLSTRKPNRKFKVPRAVLAERLKIFWLLRRLKTLLPLTLYPVLRISIKMFGTLFLAMFRRRCYKK